MAKDVGLIPKGYGKEKTGFKTIFSKIGFLFIGLAVLGLAAYGGLTYYNKSLADRLLELQQQTEELNKQRDTTFEEKVISLEATLKSLKTILKNHLFWSELFSKFEELVIPQVSFSSLDAKLQDNDSVDLVLTGGASGYTYLAKQMVSFSKNELVSDVEVSGINLSTEGGIGFSLNVDFLGEVLLK